MGINKTLLATIIANMGVGRPYPANFFINLSNAVNGVITDSQAVVTIHKGTAVTNIIDALAVLLSGGSIGKVGGINTDAVLNRTSGVAPLSVIVDAWGTTAAETARPGHELYYVTHFGDGTAGVWSEGTRVGTTKNIDLGPTAGHVYETPGTYYVKTTPLHVSSGGTFSCGMTKVSVVTATDPDTVFASNTIYVSQSGTPVAGSGGVPSGANVLHMPNWSTIKTLVSTNGYRRIRLKRGDTWPVDTFTAFDNSTTMNGAGLIDAYGTGAKPIVDTSIDAPCFSFAGVNDWRVVDVDTTSSDPAGTSISNRSSFIAGGDYLTLLRVGTSSTRIGVGAGASVGLAVVDSLIGPTSVQSTAAIGAYLDKSSKLIWMGNRCTGSYGHGVRVQGTETSVIKHNYMGDVTRAGHGHALTVRGMTNNAANATWNGLWTEKVVIADNVITNPEGFGIDALAVKPQSNINHAERLRNIIIERNYINSSDSWGAALLEVANDVTFRNNICIVQYSGLAVTVQGNNPNSPPPDSTYIYNNTLYKRSAAVDSNFVGVRITDPGPTNTIVKNNIGYAPGCVYDGFGIGPATMFKTTQTGGKETTHTATNNSSNAQLIGTRPWADSTPTDGVAFTPSGTYPIDSGVYVPVFDDHFASAPGAVRDMGAISV